MIGVSIGSSIGKPVGFNIDGSNASSGGGVTTSTFTVAASGDNGNFWTDQYYDPTPPTSYSNQTAGGSVYGIGVSFYSSSNKYRFRNTFLRFTGVTIPAGSTISAAKLKVDFLSGTERTFQINCQ